MKRLDLQFASRATAVCALAICTAFAAPMAMDFGSGLDGKAWAAGQGEGESEGGDGKQGEDSRGGKDDRADPGKKGPDLEGLDDSVAGGRPVWAKEGIPEIELGRLSVARSPDHVLERAYLEALNTLTQDMIDFYSMSFRDILYNLAINFDEVSLIDSPLQNLALLQDILENGTSVLKSDDIGVTNGDGVLLAVFLGVASDKTVPVTADTVVAVTTILGTPITGDAAEKLAAAAEAVRIAILAGHG